MKTKDVKLNFFKSVGNFFFFSFPKVKSKHFRPLATNAQYPQHVSFQAKNSATGMLASLQTGQQITVHFNLRGREFVKDGQSKYFNTLEAWKLER